MRNLLKKKSPIPKLSDAEFEALRTDLYAKANQWLNEHKTETYVGFNAMSLVDHLRPQDKTEFHTGWHQHYKDKSKYSQVGWDLKSQLDSVMRTRRALKDISQDYATQVTVPKSF